MDEHISGCVRSGEPSRFPRADFDVSVRESDVFFAGHKKVRIGIVGLGSVGHALMSVMRYFFDTKGYDIIGEHDWIPIVESDVVFVCVQTPESCDGRLDCSHVSEVLGRLSCSGYGGIVVIKSTLRVGFMDKASVNYPDLNIVYSPEFMSERNAFAWTANPDRIVLSGKKEHIDLVEQLYFWADKAERIKTDYRSAEIGKLAHNAYIALKVTFTNTMESICDSSSANANDVMKIVYTDRRVGNSAHLEPYKGPYGGKCVPKDTSELINAFGDQARLLKTADEINDQLIESYSKKQLVRKTATKAR